MAINLIKGQRVEIESGLTRLKVEMGWKVNPNAEPAYDLDASTFLLGSNGQIENEERKAVDGEREDNRAHQRLQPRPGHRSRTD